MSNNNNNRPDWDQWILQKNASFIQEKLLKAKETKHAVPGTDLHVSWNKQTESMGGAFHVHHTDGTKVGSAYLREGDAMADLHKDHEKHASTVEKFIKDSATNNPNFKFHI